MKNVDTPATKNTDPDTSKEAEQSITASGIRAQQRRIVHLLVEIWPESTSAELAKYAQEHGWTVAEHIYEHNPTEQEIKRCQLDRWQIARRLPEVQATGFIAKCQSRTCKVNGNRCVTWEPARV